jgi:hypothetical protein
MCNNQLIHNLLRADRPGKTAVSGFALTEAIDTIRIIEDRAVDPYAAPY